MSLLTTLGMASMLLTAVFTWRAYYRVDTGAGPQTARQAIIEAWANIVIGFSINYSMNLVILPLVGIAPTLAQNFWLGWVYTAVSIVRQYALRRWFNDRIHTFAARAARRLS
jgi:hypothetical protein